MATKKKGNPFAKKGAKMPMTPAQMKKMGGKKMPMKGM